MPYLQVELDAMDKWPMVAVGCGIPEATVYKGFLSLWKTCWREQSATTTPIHLECFFDMPVRGERAVQVLCAFGFLEKTETGFRVGGAEKYLRIKEARSKGGKKASGNLKRGKSPGSSRKAAGKQPEDTPGSTPALTAVTNQQSAITLETIPPKTAAESDGEYQALVDSLFAVFRKIKGKDPEPSGRDWKALQRLRARTKQGPTEIVCRFERGLQAGYKQRVDCFEDLEAKWDSLASGDPPKRAANGRFFDAKDADHSKATPGIQYDF